MEESRARSRRGSRLCAVVSPESFVWTGERGYNMMVVP